MLQMNVNSLFKNCSGMVPDVEDFFGFRFKTSLLTSSRDTDLKWKLSVTISGYSACTLPPPALGKEYFCIPV